ncbi:MULTISPECIES: tautomerase family protein [Rhizobium/Agrobacterium group]|jgi:4-oxalocrotonate tautomerase|uniref:tautomerase family protein n=1 Tax=Rhizobium/Agrobacterium group TaxID=227290 RepID=UPI000629F19B|nr:MULTISPECIES: tautomerase family protein [Rhizobium/Agrobacterium group]KKX23731.1 4-oxalocrotonate tautomerase [Rhizobium sp. LC145]KNY30817.1 4-oxalocrotonate tautomerase [Agrobacterium sp. SUL3]TKT42649.1 4-oxalocrotonate tautomerase [Rhizobiaceae bacterium LC148]
MPHIVIKAMAGRSEEQKKRLAQAIARDVVDILECDEASVSVAFEDVASGRWKDEVYLPDIQGHRDRLYKKPGYEM